MKDLVFLPITHQYFLGGKELISVTKCLEVIGITDFSRVPAAILEPARQRGHAVHQMAALYAIGLLDGSSVDYALAGYLEAIKKFFAEEVGEIINVNIETEEGLVPVPAVEQAIYDASHGYAGTPDLVYRNKKTGKISVDDHKTPIKIHPATKVQCAAYANAFQKMHKIKIEERAGISLRSDGTYLRDIHTNPLRRDFDDFTAIQRAAYLKLSWKIK